MVRLRISVNDKTYFTIDVFRNGSIAEPGAAVLERCEILRPEADGMDPGPDEIEVEVVEVEGVQ
jgi:hypothetical protein